MKTVILILSITFLFISCKKKQSVTPKTEIYCCYYSDNSDTRFYKCASSKEEMQQYAIQVRNAGLGTFSYKIKSNCSECN